MVVWVTVFWRSVVAVVDVVVGVVASGVAVRSELVVLGAARLVVVFPWAAVDAAVRTC